MLAAPLAVVAASGHAQPVPIFQQFAGCHRLVVRMYVRYPLSLGNVEDLLAERGIDISHETIRFRWNRYVRRRDRKEAGSACAPLSSVAVAFGRGLGEDQRQALLSLARRRSWRRGFGGGGHCKAGQSCDGEASQADHEEIRPTSEVRYRRASRLFCGDEGGRRRRSAGGRSRAQESRGEFASVASTTRACRAALSKHEDVQKLGSVHAQVHNHFNQERPLSFTIRNGAG